MARKKTLKRPAKKKVSKRQAGLRVGVKRDPRFLRRLAELGVSPVVVDEAVLAMVLELDRKHRPAEMAFLLEAAVQAIKTAAFASADPEQWIKAGRKAGGLD